MAIRFTPCFLHRRASVCRAPAQSRRGSCGYTVAVSTSLPVASTTATFTPVRMPGSRPITTRGPAGAASNKSRRLSANTLMATFSASSRSRANRSRSSDSDSFTRQVQATHLRSRSSAGRHPADGLVVVEVVAELGDVGMVLVLAGGQLAAQQAFLPQPFAQGLHQGRLLGPALRQDVAHA